MTGHAKGSLRLIAAGLAAMLPLGAVQAQSTEVMPLATKRSLMLDIADGDQRAIMVGERGHVLVSESRSDWRQVANVPTRLTLTAVATVGEHAWAVGHDGVILHSADGGLNWEQQRIDPWVPPSDDAEFDPQAGAPLLDVLFVDTQTGFAVGAYSLLLRTRDGGATWEKVALSADAGDGSDAAPADDAAGADDSWTFDQDELVLDEEDDPHLNGIVRTESGLLFIVAERGAGFRSRDGGETWERLSLPYDGSMFGVISFGPEHLLAFGLRGNMLETRDGGDSWTEIDTGTTLSLLGGAALPDGGAVVVGANGVVLYRPDAASAFALGTYENADQETPVLSSVRPQGSRTFLVAGEKGFGRYQAN